MAKLALIWRQKKVEEEEEEEGGGERGKGRGGEVDGEREGKEKMCGFLCFIFSLCLISFYFYLFCSFACLFAVVVLVVVAVAVLVVVDEVNLDDAGMDDVDLGMDEERSAYTDLNVDEVGERRRSRERWGRRGGGGRGSSVFLLLERFLFSNNLSFFFNYYFSFCAWYFVFLLLICFYFFSLFFVIFFGFSGKGFFFFFPYTLPLPYLRNYFLFLSIFICSFNIFIEICFLNM
jgi:hypothetical protein